MKITKSLVDNYLKNLFPINRSITGEGNRKTLSIIKQIIPIKTYEIPTGTKVYDWTIPKEWSVKEAWLKNSKGIKVIDFKKSNLHILNYSIPYKGKLKLSDFRSKLFFNKNNPDSIPYKTSYYNKNWGFCLSYNVFKKFFNDDNEIFEIYIDTELKDGSLTIADYDIDANGLSAKSYFFSTYFCHPSLANDNLSGTLLTALLASKLKNKKLRNNYKFIFVPETIGSISYCAKKTKEIKAMSGGFILSCIAGPGKYSYKKTFLNDSEIDKAVQISFKDLNIPFDEYPFIPQGSDERQYSSPGFRIPVASIHKSKYNEYDEYHNSSDNLDFISSTNMINSLNIYLYIIDVLEKNVVFESCNKNCEPKLDKHNLYPKIGRTFLSKNSIDEELNMILWLLFYADKKNFLLDIAIKHNFNFLSLWNVLKKLEKKRLIKVS